ncbi:hypothetical protein [Rariglobus hedericola]|uniref:Uncharacterized protein n=1 Tax=Rariglobus hedericola TaxID=2597822 RepID=A0A556QER4_9BACT|nr:hypothetical protein [Rariglobus hedericola]TSJ75142.1 hypothetical protein FPL22_17240 [Rariglobus hedericola]
MKYLIMLALSALPLIGMPTFNGSTYKEYESWRSAGMLAGTITEAEWRPLIRAESKIMHFIDISAEIRDEAVAKEIFVRLIRNKSLADIELIAALVDLTKQIRFQSEFELIAIQNDRLRIEASTEERKEYFKKLFEMGAENRKEMDSAVLAAKENLTNKIK